MLEGIPSKRKLSFAPKRLITTIYENDVNNNDNNKPQLTDDVAQQSDEISTCCLQVTTSETDLTSSRTCSTDQSDVLDCLATAALMLWIVWFCLVFKLKFCFFFVLSFYLARGKTKKNSLNHLTRRVISLSFSA